MPHEVNRLDQEFTRIDLGPVMDGRNVAVADFTGNGLKDIFIVCVSDSHVLLLQTAPGVFKEFLVANTSAAAGGEARGVAVGRLFGKDSSLEVSHVTHYQMN